MQSHLKRLIIAFEDLNLLHGFGGITVFDGDMWQTLGRQSHAGALAVMVLGDIVKFFNCYLPYTNDGITEFDDLFSSFGFCFDYDLHTSSVGIYILAGFDFAPVTTRRYTDILQDPRWKSKAELVKLISGNRCADCGATGRLEAHHCYYKPKRNGFYPWEYPLSTFRALCPTCHDVRGDVELRFRAWSSNMSSQELLALTNGVDSVAGNIGITGVLRLLVKFSELGYRLMNEFAQGGDLAIEVNTKKLEPAKRRDASKEHSK
ncbi:hypothetical protein ACXX83_22280 [Pseudomonas sp. GNP012]